jgi:allantoate deiminase
VLAVERLARAELELVATVGRLEAQPGAINVIPGRVRFSVDVRAPVDAMRERGVDAICAELETLCRRRGAVLRAEPLQAMGVAACAPWLVECMERAIAAEGVARVRRLPSGAGHDGMSLQGVADIVMLFVRCRGGISHNPAEAISAADAETGARVLLRFIEGFGPR